MIDETVRRVTSVALVMMVAAENAGFSDDDTFAAAQHIIKTRDEIASRLPSNVIHLRGRVEAPSRASRQPSITGAGALRSVAAFAPVVLTRTNTDAAETGGQPSSLRRQE